MRKVDKPIIHLYDDTVQKQQFIQLEGTALDLITLLVRAAHKTEGFREVIGIVHGILQEAPTEEEMMMLLHELKHGPDPFNEA